MPIKSGIYVITNAQQGNPAFLESPDDEVPLRGYSKPENACEEWHWRVIDWKNGRHSIQNVKHNRYANCGSRAGLKAHVRGDDKDQKWFIRESRCEGEYTIAATDTSNVWMLPDSEDGTPVELFNVPTDRRCWWTFKNVETGNLVKEDAAYGAYLFALNPLPILPFSPLRLDFIIIQQMTDDSVSNASRTIAGVCGRLVSLGRIQRDAICVNIIEIMAVESDIFFERSYDVVTFEKLSNLEGAGISWEECDGAPLLPTMAMRGLRANTTKIAILNLSDTLLQQGGEAIIELINSLAEHDITLILTPIQTTWERAFSKSVVFRELKELSSEYRRFRQEGQFSDYVGNYNQTDTSTRLKKHPEIRDTIRENIPHIIEVLKSEDKHTQSAAVAALSQLAEYAELRDTILETVPKIVEMLEGNKGEAEAATSALTKLAEHALLCDVLNTKNNNGLTPLLVAAADGREAVVCMLLAHAGVDVNAKDNDGRTPLSRAAANGRVPVVRLLLAHAEVDVDAKGENGWTPLSWAVTCGQYAVVGLLLAHAAVDVNARDKDGWTPLSRAAVHWNDTVLRLLLAHPRVDVNAKSNYGATPLWGAAANGHEPVVRLLLAHPGIDVNAEDNHGSTPLSSAATNGRDAVARILLAHPGIAVNAKNKDGLTPLSWAALHGHDAVVRLLLAHPGIDVNAKDKNGSTPLSWAAWKGHDAAVRLLLAHPGIGVNTKDKYGFTPLSRAADGGHDEVVKLLRERSQ